MKRKYYKRCKRSPAYRFAPTGAIQPFRLKGREILKEVEAINNLINAKIKEAKGFNFFKGGINL